MVVDVVIATERLDVDAFDALEGEFDDLGILMFDSVTFTMSSAVEAVPRLSIEIVTVSFVESLPCTKIVPVESSVMLQRHRGQQDVARRAHRHGA